MKRITLLIWALIISAAFVMGDNRLSDTEFTLGFLTNCDSIDTDASGSFSCGVDADTTYTAFYPYIYLNSTTFGINTTAVQKRVSGTCAVGSSIREIAEDGSVTCETDSTGTDDQTLVYNTGNNTITIENGNSINISEVDTDTTCDGASCNVANTGTLDGYEASALLDNTDSQTLSYDAATDVITISGGNSIDITEVDTDTHLTEDEVEAYIFDEDNAANLNVTGYKVCFNADCTAYMNSTHVCLASGGCITSA